MLFFLYGSFPYNASPHQLKSEHLRNKSEVEDDDCSLGKIEARPCMNDIKGLSSHLVMNGHFHSCNPFKENCQFLLFSSTSFLHLQVFLLGSSNRFTCHSAAKTLLILLRYLEEVVGVLLCFCSGKLDLKGYQIIRASILSKVQ